jgi:hypothetical protein
LDGRRADRIGAPKNIGHGQPEFRSTPHESVDILPLLMLVKPQQRPLRVVFAGMDRGRTSIILPAVGGAAIGDPAVAA